MNESPPLRLGAFGVGRMGRVHVENLARLASDGTIEFVAIGDRDEPTLSKTLFDLGEQGHGSIVSGIERFDHPDAMAQAERIDAVVVASRVKDHCRDALPFARGGIPVMVEKPIAGTIAEAAELIEHLGEDADRLLFVAFQRHFDRAAQSASEWVSQGLIGHLQQSHHVIQDKNPTPVGYQSGGITSDMAIHLIFESMSFRNFELPRYVQALRFNAPHYDDRASEGANVVHTFCSWADGSLAHLWGSRLNVTGYDNGFKLIGTRGRIDVGEFTGDFGDVTAKLWCGDGRGEMARGTLCESLSFPMTRGSSTHPDFYPRYAQAYEDELGGFIRSVSQAETFQVGPDIGWKTLLVANVAEASSQCSGQRFDLTLDGSPPQTAHQAAELAACLGVC